MVNFDHLREDNLPRNGASPRVGDHPRDMGHPVDLLVDFDHFRRVTLL